MSTTRITPVDHDPGCRFRRAARHGFDPTTCARCRALARLLAAIRRRRCGARR